MTRRAIFFLIGCYILSSGAIGFCARELFGWNRESAQRVYWCGIVRGSRQEAGLPREMPNSEAECSALERALAK